MYEQLKLIDSVQFIHTIDKDEKELLASKSDLFVLPSVSLETFGLTMIEAISMGLPVISTPCGFPQEFLEKVDLRLIARDNSPESIANTITWFCKLKKNKKELIIKNAQLQIEKGFSLNKYSDLLIKLYVDTLNEREA